MKFKAIMLGAMLLAGASAPALATEFVQNGDFSTLNSGGLGQQDYDNHGAADWTNGKSGNNLGYNFVFTNGGDDVTGKDGTLSLWTQGNGGASTWDGLAGGTGNFVAMDGDYETAAVSQTITGLTVGDTYTFSFDYAFGQQKGFNGQTWQDLTASLGTFSVTVPSAFHDCTGGLGDGQSCEGGQKVDSHGFSGWSTYTTTITADATSETLSFLADGSKPVPPFAMISDVSLTGGVPEVSTWAMMGLGFAGLGFAGFRANRRKAIAIA